MLSNLLSHLAKPSSYQAGRTHSHPDHTKSRHPTQPGQSTSSASLTAQSYSSSRRTTTSTSRAPPLGQPIQWSARYSSPRRSRSRTHSQSCHPELQRVEERPSSYHRHRHRRHSTSLPPTTQSHASTSHTSTRSLPISSSRNEKERSQMRRQDQFWIHGPHGERRTESTSTYLRDDTHHGGQSRGRQRKRTFAPTLRREGSPISSGHAWKRSNSGITSPQTIHLNGKLYPYATSDREPLHHSCRSSSSSSAHRVAFNPYREVIRRHSPPPKPPYLTNPVREVNRPVLAERHDPRTGKAYYQYIGSLPTYLPTQHADRSSFNSKAKRNRHGSQDTRRGTRPPGFYNRRGDKFIRRGVIRRQSNPAMEWHQVFDGYPDPGQGWMDEDGNWLPEQGGILKH